MSYVRQGKAAEIKASVIFGYATTVVFACLNLAVNYN